MATFITPNAGLYQNPNDTYPPETSGYPLNNKPTVIDGDKNTEIGSANGWNTIKESYGLDLGSSQTVGSFKIYDDHGAGGADNGQLIVLYGENNSDWTELETFQIISDGLSRSGGSPGIWEFTLSSPPPARYWRIYISSALNVGGTAIGVTEVEAYELEVNEMLKTIESNTQIFIPELEIATSDTSISKEFLETSTSDASIKIESLKTIVSDALIIKETIDSNSQITKETIESNTLISKGFLETINSTAWVLAYTTADPNVFNIPLVNVPGEQGKDYREPKLKHVCDHKLTSGTFTLNTCPRCLGQGYYYDIKIDEDGTIPQVFREDKLLQELEKITITPLGNNLFHEAYGTLVDNVFSSAPSRDLRETLLKQSIIAAVGRIQTNQQLEIRRGYGFSPAELITNIEKIEVFDVYEEPRSIGYRVYIMTAQGLQKREGVITL